MPTIYIDDEAYQVPEGDNVLQACLSAGIDLPYFAGIPRWGRWALVVNVPWYSIETPKIPAGELLWGV